MSKQSQQPNRGFDGAENLGTLTFVAANQNRAVDDLQVKYAAAARVWAVRLGVVTILALGGCDGLASSPRRRALNAADQARVETACQGCHVLPAADILPRARWRELIPTMTSMPIENGIRPPTVSEMRLAIAHYDGLAPESLAPIEPAKSDASRIHFEIEGFTPPGLEKERIPAVGGVRFVDVDDSGRLSLIAAEMRTGSVLRLDAGAEGRARRFVPIVQGLAYPVRTTVVSTAQRGAPELLVAEIGAMNPSNETRGSVSLLSADADGKYTTKQLVGELGRACDVCIADLDNDADLDLIVSAFGWRGPGALQLYFNGGGSLAAATFEVVTLDERDGFLESHVTDLDGDGRLDILALVSQHYEELLLFRCEGERKFAPHVIHRAEHPAWGFSGFEPHDFDGDGDLDVLISNGDTLDDNQLKPYHGVSWLENRGNMQFEPRTITPLYGCEDATAADLDLDGDLDVVAVSFLPQLPPATWIERGIDSIVWVEKLPDGAWRTHSLEKHHAYHPAVTVGDYNADGHPDIAAANYIWIGADGVPFVRADYLTLMTAAW
ncbi:MAG: FG-GAP repeat domain-containing protein [Planctomycetota bacterium]